MEYVTDYIVVQGELKYFEKELNRLSEQGYIWCGNMNSNIHEGKIIYSQLMSKTKQK